MWRSGSQRKKDLEVGHRQMWVKAPRRSPSTFSFNRCLVMPTPRS